jgi:hypothetical protein
MSGASLGSLLGASRADSVAHLDDEVTYYSAVVRVHTGTEGVEDAGHTHIHIGLSVVSVPAGMRRRRGTRAWQGSREQGYFRGEERREEEPYRITSSTREHCALTSWFRPPSFLRRSKPWALWGSRCPSSPPFGGGSAGVGW